MELLNSTISINSQVSPSMPFLSWKSRKNPSRLLTIPSSRNLHLQQRSFSPYLFRSPSKKFQISAHFGRPTKRQNYLRKKLNQQRQLHQHQQQQQVSHIKIPVDEFDKVDISELGFDDSGETSKNIDKSSGLDNESNFDSSYENNKESGAELEKKEISESIMRNKLENWAEQYKKDSEFWGIGTGPVFTIYQDSDGKVKRVVVNEDEIMRRSRVDPLLASEKEDLAKANSKISFAKDLAREMESGINVIHKNSTVAKFLPSDGESRFMEAIRGNSLKPVSFSSGGLLVICGLFVVWGVRGLLTVGKHNKKHTRLEKEMLRRKIKARNEKEKIVIGNVEVMQNIVESKSVPFKRPQLDKEELVNSILNANGLNNEEAIVETPGYEKKEFNDKIEEIKAMARHAREIEKRDSLVDDCDKEDHEQESKGNSEDSEIAENEFFIENEVYVKDSDETIESTSLTGQKDEIFGQKSEMEISEDSVIAENDVLIENEVYAGDSDETIEPTSLTGQKDEIFVQKAPNGTENLRFELSKNLHFDGTVSQLRPQENPSKKKLRIIKSAEEAKEYLSMKHQKPEANQESEAKNDELIDIAINDSSPLSNSSHTSEDRSMDSEMEDNLDSLNDLELSRISSGHEVSISNRDNGESTDEIPQQEETDYNESEILANTQKEEVSTPLKKHNSEVSSVRKENWVEKNFHEFEPIVKKIGEGFRDNYNLGREKASEEYVELKSFDAEDELEWMKDEKLRDIVFKVRDNELSGRDPFHLMDGEDKRMFFSGLEKKVEQANEKLLNLHEYLHSNIENLDYGGDGISIFDPPEKIIPHWKTPPAERNPEFLNNSEKQRKISSLSENPENNAIEKPEESSPRRMGPKELQKDTLKSSKTVIESSDGSVRAGKKGGKEFWQHTKKWSEGFLEVYNAETDPEVKAVMRDMGKDLDRWITEDEIKQAADRINRVPEQKFIKEKLEKVKREMELFGQQAVLNKYREYAEEKEEDYLWWLDLPFVLCIELYKIEKGEQKIGFYSLEMAADLELNPKQYHVIAFEDAADCKNLCYIINTHMEMVGNGNAFVVAQPPKDAFRDAKANGFSVTVIRKGELQLNIDQTLEEVEEMIEEIGSKIYHDKITKERSVDINSVMKGVFGVDPTKRGRRRKKLKRKPKRRTKP